MCDLSWEEVRMTHKQLNIPDHSIFNPGVVSRSSVTSALLHSAPPTPNSHDRLCTHFQHLSLPMGELTQTSRGGPKDQEVGAGV